MKPILVLACGNPLRSDDGAGWRVAEALRDGAVDSAVSVHAVQQFTPELAEEISQAEMVIFVDSAADEDAGAVAVSTVAEAPASTARFTHSLTPATLLSLARRLFGAAPEKALLVTVGASRFELSEKLSEPVARAIPEAVAAIRSLALTL